MAGEVTVSFNPAGLGEGSRIWAIKSGSFLRRWPLLNCRSCGQAHKGLEPLRFGGGKCEKDQDPSKTRAWESLSNTPESAKMGTCSSEQIEDPMSSPMTSTSRAWMVGSREGNTKREEARQAMRVNIVRLQDGAYAAYDTVGYTTVGSRHRLGQAATRFWVGAVG